MTTKRGSVQQNGHGGAGAGPVTTSVQVALRIRPTTPQDAISIPTRWQRSVIQPLSSTSISVDVAPSAPGGTPSKPGKAGADKVTFSFDRVHGPDAGQADLYRETAEPLVRKFIEGFNVTVLAYGQTSSGKSYSMGTSGLDADYDSSPSPDADSRLGIIPRAVVQIFQLLSQKPANTFSYQIKNSFIEIYNEDLIDLLADGTAGAVQIREATDGTIIWSGLRESAVRSAGDVMANLKAGSALRQTNHTDMNAQSSRSHAIFSLTLVQRKYVGSNPPSPAPAAPSTPQRQSGIARPGRVASPTFGSRPNTPSSFAALGSGKSALRPPSVLGNRSPSPAFGARDEDEGRKAGGDDGDWVTITSKFHFVDLAGSERLKRTAAQGERRSEAISINSGLLALGNVISALGDPSVAKRTTHIPYRDSKLTRLLQDSLGGNAQTTMIACVSPAEYNTNETLNTLKYANRARNIKNKAEVNEVEVGWDDVDYLQSTVTKLRRELASLKGTGKLPPGGASDARLKEEYTNLESKYEARTSELDRLKRELAEQPVAVPSSPTTAASKASSFAEMVAPVIEEYEKTISSLESELKLTKAALSHTNAVFVDKETELEELAERHSSSLTLIEDLKLRVSRLADRESTTESYVRELEDKIKAYSEGDDASAVSISELRKDIARYKEQEANTEKYIKDLEAKLARTDEGSAALAAQVEKLERQAAERDEAFAALQEKLALAESSSDKRDLLNALDERDARLTELEARLEALVDEKQDLAAERLRLREEARKEEGVRETLKKRIAALEDSSRSAAAVPLPTPTASDAAVTAPTTPNETSTPTEKRSPEDLTPPTTPQGSASDSHRPPADDPAADAARADDVVAVPSAPPSEQVVGGLREELRVLQETHSRTLSELEDLSSRYRDSLREIGDLHSQIEEARLIGAEKADRLPSSPSFAGPETPEFSPSDSGSDDSPRGASSSPRGRRRRMSVDPGATATSPGSVSRRFSAGFGRAPLAVLPPGAPTTAQHGRTSSLLLSQELSSARGSRSSWAGPPSPNRISPIRPMSLFGGPQERSIASLEREIQTLQKTLKEREEEIALLERELPHARQLLPAQIPLPPSPANGTRDLPAETDTLPPPAPKFLSTLSPSTSQNFDALRQGLDSEGDQNEQHLQRLNELMSSMAQKESSHREVVDKLSDQLEVERRQHEELKMLSRNQVANMSTELENLRQQLRLVDEERIALADKVSEAGRHATDAAETRKLADEAHASVLRRAISSHEDALRKKDEELAAALAERDERHAEEIKRGEIERAGTLTESQEEHAEILARLRDEHQAASEKRDVAHAAALSKLKDDHAGALSSRDEEHATALETLKAEHATLLARATDDRAREAEAHQAALARHREDAERAAEKAKADAAAALAAAAEEHNANVARIRKEHDEALTQQAAAHAVAFAALTETHAKDLESLKSDLTRSASELAEHKSLAAQHLERVDVAERGRSALEEELRTLRTTSEAAALAVSTHRDDSATELAAAKEQLEALQKQNAEEVRGVKAELQEALDALQELEKAMTEAQAERDNLQAQSETLRADLEKAREEHATVATQLNDRDSMAQDLETHRSSLYSLQLELARTKEEMAALAAEREKQDAALRELEAKVADVNTLRVDNGPALDLAQPPRSPRLSRLNTGANPPNGSIPPPPTPPPSVPPPPVPSTQPALPPLPRPVRSSTSSRPESSTSVRSGSTDATSIAPVADAQMAKQLEEADQQIRTLTKQLDHCEADLQANIDLVQTLENALMDSERSLRKARVQMNELAKERDAANASVASLRMELEEKQNEIESARNSVAEEKRASAAKIDEERAARERARMQLEQRMEEMQKKKSKLRCF